ncbi:MAG TPA: hypothetical protein VNB23_07820 [Ramlibacter sp.]|nr:hypothetical protein [Ramlibacter sp.]
MTFALSAPVAAHAPAFDPDAPGAPPLRPVELNWNNHYRITYNGTEQLWRESPDDFLNIRFAGCGREPMSVTAECINSAQIIHERYGAPIVLYSGGMDSEVILACYQALGLRPRVIVMDNGLNAFDLRNARAYLAYHGMPHEVVAFDFRELLDSGEAEDLCVRYQCAQIGLAGHLKGLETFCRQGYVITGDDPCIQREVDPITNTASWYFMAREPYYAQMKVFLANGVDGCLSFLEYTPEQWLAFWRDPILQWLVSPEQDRWHNSNAVKYDVYTRRFFLRRRRKSTGVEPLASRIEAMNAELALKHPLLSDSELKYPYARMIRDMGRYL